MCRLLCAVLAAACSAAPPAAAAPTVYEAHAAAGSVRFSGRSSLHAFAGSCGPVNGRIVFDPSSADLVEAEPLVFRVEELVTGEPVRDRGMHRLLRAETRPEIVYRPLKVVRLGPGRYRLEGVLSMAGRDKRLALHLRGTPEGGGERLRGTFPLDLRWFSLRPPNVLGLVRVDPRVRVRLDVLWEPSR